MHTVTRYHDFCAGHRVCGHESKCQHLHGHNYRVHFECAREDGLDGIGRVVDFAVIKTRLCQWLEDNWDHRFLIYENDPWLPALQAIDPSVTAVPFNPTAENMAEYLVRRVGPSVMLGSMAKLVSCTVEETAKCSASFRLT